VPDLNPPSCRSGKTSIQQVLFNDVPPKQTFYLEPTLKAAKHRYDTVIPLEIWDCPGNTTPESLGASLADFSSIIFVIDIQDSYQQPIARMLDFFAAAYQENPGATLEVFVHKAESLAEDYKIGTWSCDTQFTSAILSAWMGLTPAPPLDLFA
jgi:Ras-related GTP-binding protein C/D